MNERIKELIEQAYVEVPHERDWDATSSVFDKEKFAELIMRETFNWIIDNVGLMEDQEWQQLKQHFGVK